MTRTKGIRLSIAAALVMLMAGCADITGPVNNGDDPPPERGIIPVGG